MKHETCTAEIKLRLPPSLRDRVEVAAAADRRKPSQFLRNIIEDALAHRDGGERRGAAA
jgi:predicted DNA-binding protein